MPDGSTRRQHLEVARRQGAVVPELDVEPLPMELLYIWEWFVELQRGRQNNGFSINPISWSELRAWRLENGLPQLTAFELKALRALDSAYVGHSAERAEEEQKKRAKNRQAGPRGGG